METGSAGCACRIARHRPVSSGNSTRFSRLCLGGSDSRCTRGQPPIGRHGPKPGGRFGATEQLALRIGFGEALAQLAFGLPMSASEEWCARPLSVAEAEARVLADNPAVARFLAQGSTPETRAAFAALLAEWSASG